ncbi:MAG: spore germination protein [Thermacetogeniaceae bacterium]|nr:spore germination protein [Syntrophomonadaceae bacterium]
MLRFLSRLRNLSFLLKEKNNYKNSSNKAQQLTPDLKKNIKLFRQVLGESSDVIIRQFKIARGKKDATLIFLEGLVNKKHINDHILRPLMVQSQTSLCGTLEKLKDSFIFIDNISELKDFGEIVSAVLEGKAVLLVDGAASALVIDVKGWEQRAIEEPDTEGGVRGPREGFTENIRTNIALLRRIIRDPALTFYHLRLGNKTKRDISIAYIKGVAQDSLIDEVKYRLNKIETDAVLESGYIEQLIDDNPFSPFPTIANSEKPDKVAAKLLEGRAAILVDGTPFVLTVPMLFIECFQHPEDYYVHPYFGTFMRWIRYISFALSILSPAYFVALSSFDHELIPTPLLISMAAAREGTPFPAVLEALLMIIVFEILREASIRMPRSLGQAVNIVGALVIGQAAVSAGLIGPAMVIVISLTAVATFIVPPLIDVGTILRFALLFGAGVLGLFGVTIILLEILIHLASLKSFGVPYLSPVAPPDIAKLKDVLVRAPLWSMPRTRSFRQKLGGRS